MELTDRLIASNGLSNEEKLTEENKQLADIITTLTLEKKKLQSSNRKLNEDIRTLSKQIDCLTQENERLNQRIRPPSCLKKPKNKTVRFSINKNTVHEMSESSDSTEVLENNEQQSLLKQAIKNQSFGNGQLKEQRGFTEAHKRVLRSMLQNNNPDS